MWPTQLTRLLALIERRIVIVEAVRIESNLIAVVNGTLVAFDHRVSERWRCDPGSRDRGGDEREFDHGQSPSSEDGTTALAVRIQRRCIFQPRNVYDGCHSPNASPSTGRYFMKVHVFVLLGEFGAPLRSAHTWLNRIPGAAWALLGLTAIFANFLMGYRERSTGMFALLVLPIVVSIAFFLLADIDSPSGGGVIHIAPHNLISVSQSMAKH